MIKLNIQLFGGDDSNRIDDNEKNVSFKIGGGSVVLPSYVFSNQGSAWRSDKKQAKTSIAGIAYAQYHGLENLDGVSVKEVRDWVNSSSVQLFDTDGNLISGTDIESPNFKFMNLNGSEGDTMNGLNDLFKDLKTAQENGEMLINGAVVTDKNDFIYQTTPTGKPIPGAVDANGNQVIKGGTNDTNSLDNETPLDNAYNQYYNDIMAYDQEGTLGNAILNSQVSLKTGEANNAAMLAEANLQSQALGQAQSVRDVVNSLKSERMSQLRAGMNQAQLADRELQMLVGSAGQLAQQNQMARQDAVAADLGQNTAYDMAFNDYIAQAQALGQNAAANYAALVGDSIAQAKRLEEAKKKRPGFLTNFNQTTGTPPSN